MYRNNIICTCIYMTYVNICICYVFTFIKDSFCYEFICSVFELLGLAKTLTLFATTGLDLTYQITQLKGQSHETRMGHLD